MMVMLINGWYIEVSSKVPDTILMLLDMDLGTLSFMVDNRSVRQLIVNLTTIWLELKPIWAITSLRFAS